MNHKVMKLTVAQVIHGHKPGSLARLSQRRISLHSITRSLAAHGKKRSKPMAGFV